MTSQIQIPNNIKLRNALASPPPYGATLASFALFASLTSLLAMVYAGGEWWGMASFGLSSDAGWVRAVFARNLASGQLLSFNPGTPVAGAAAPAWVLPLGILGYLLGYVLAAKALGALCIVLAAFLTWRITLDLLGDWRFAFLAGLLVASSPLLLASAAGGTEGALGGMLLAALCYWQAGSWEGVRRQRTALVVVAALAALTRPELILLLPLLALDRWLVAARHGLPGGRFRSALACSLPEAIGAGVLLVPYLLFNARAGGPLWQQPVMALRAQSPLVWMVAVLSDLWAGNPLLLCAALLGLPVVALAAARSASRHPSFLLVLSPLALLLAPGMIWRYLDRQNATFAAAYLTPVVVVLATAGLFALKRAGDGFVQRSKTRAARIVFGVGIACVLLGLTVLTWFAHGAAWQQHSFLVKKQNDLQGYLGRWVADHTAPDASVASREVGAIGFFSRRRMVDLGGSIDRQALRGLRGPGSPDANLLAFMEKAQPSYLAIRPSDFPDLSQRVDLLTPVVTCAEQDPIAGGVTTWVLYETLWPAPSARAARAQTESKDHGGNHSSRRHR